MSSKRNKRMDPPTTKHSRLRKMKAVDLRDTSAQTKFRNQVDPEKAREIAIKQTESHLERLKRGNTDPLKSLEASHCFPLGEGQLTVYGEGSPAGLETYVVSIF
eukprot:717924_1